MQRAANTITGTESIQLLEQLKIEKGSAKQIRRSVRNQLIVLLMLDAGLRIGEVVRLKKSDLWHFTTPVENLLIRAMISKSKTERMVPLSDRLKGAVLEMNRCVWFRVEAGTDGYALTLKPGKGPITRRQIERIVGDAARSAFGRPIHPHILRHTFATRLMKKVNSRIVQELLGHKHLTSTQVYTHPDGDDLKSAIDSINV